MPADEHYRRQVALLVRTLPLVAQEKCFALKGGITAINLFDVRDLLATEGIDTRLRNAFIVYLISHAWPMAEAWRPQDVTYRRSLLGALSGRPKFPSSSRTFSKPAKI